MFKYIHIERLYRQLNYYFQFKTSEKNNLRTVIICFHDIDNGLEPISINDLKKLYKEFTTNGYEFVYLSDARLRNNTHQKLVSFTFDDNCVGWLKIPPYIKPSFCLNTRIGEFRYELDKHSWRKLAKIGEVFNHGNVHSECVYSSERLLRGMFKGLPTMNNEFLVLPFGAPYHLDRFLISKTLSKEYIVVNFPFTSASEKHKSNERIIFRVPYYEGDTYLDIIQRHNGNSKFLLWLKFWINEKIFWFKYPFER